MIKKVLAIPDVHFPFSVDLSQIYSAIEREKPDLVIQLGDLYDFYSYSKFARSVDLMTPSQEVQEGRQHAEHFWLDIRKSGHKKMRMVQLAGNHDKRIEKRIYEKFPEIASLVDLTHLYRFPNVETIDSDREFFKQDGVNYVHGWLSGIGKHATYFDCSVVHGHTHRAGLQFYPRHGRVIFELDCGYLADPTSRPLSYSSSVTTHWVHGYGVIDQYGPRFCPLVVKK